MPSPFIFQSGLGGGASSGGSVGINYAEAYFDGTDVTGITSSNAGLTYTVNTASSPLRADGNIRLSKDANNRTGQYWTIPLTAIDLADRDGSKTMFITVRVRTSAAYASSDVRIRIYDNDAAAYVNVSSLTDSSGYLYASPDCTLFTGSFSTTESSDSLELRVYVDTVNASAYDLDIIDLAVSPASVVPGAIGWGERVTTSTIGATTTPPTKGTIAFDKTVYWRDMEHLYVRYTLRQSAAGANGSGTYLIPLPESLTADTTDMVIGSLTGGTDVGSGKFYNGSTTFDAHVVLWNSTNLAVQIQSATADYAAWGSANGGLGNTTVEMTFTAKVKISNWSASAALSTTETMMRGVNAFYTVSSSTANASFADATTEIVDFDTRVIDTHSAVTVGASWKFTAPKTAKFLLSGILNWDTTTNMNYTVADVYKNGSFLYRLDFRNGTTGQQLTFPSALISLNQGDYIDIRASQDDSAGAARSLFTAVTGYSYFSISEYFDPTIFSVYGQTELFPNTGYSSGGLVNYTTTAGNFGDFDSETLQPGEYDCDLQANYFSNGATTTTNVGIGLSTTSGNSGTGLVTGESFMNQTKSGTSGASDSVSLNIRGIVVTTPTTYYFKSQAQTSITNLQVGWSWRCRRIK